MCRRIADTPLHDERRGQKVMNGLPYQGDRPSLPSDCRPTSVLSPKYEVFCCDQNGPPARREEGAYLKRYVTDEQRSRRPIFIATLWAGVSWLFFRVARSTRIT